METQENGQTGALALDAWLGLSISEKLRAHFPKPCKPRKAHHCRLCGGKIEVGEPCCKWEYLEPGDGHSTSHAHQECYQYTIDAKWGDGDWECMAPGDISRPNARDDRRRAPDSAQPNGA